MIIAKSTEKAIVIHLENGDIVLRERPYEPHLTKKAAKKPRPHEDEEREGRHSSRPTRSPTSSLRQQPPERCRARVAELVDAADLSPAGVIHAGSSPASRTFLAAVV